MTPTDPVWSLPVLWIIFVIQECCFYHIIFFIFLIQQSQYWFSSLLERGKTLSQYAILGLFNNLTGKSSSHLKFHTPLTCQWLWHNLLNFLYYPLSLNLGDKGKVNILVRDPLLSLLSTSTPLCIYSLLSPLSFPPSIDKHFNPFHIHFCVCMGVRYDTNLFTTTSFLNLAHMFHLSDW